MTTIEVIGVFIIFAATGVVGQLLNRWILIPYSLLLVVLGYCLSLSIDVFHWDSGIRATNFQDLMLFAILPALIFEAAFSLDSQKLLRWLPNIITLATIGLLISTVLTAVFLFHGINHPGFPFIAALITGAVVSATDPVAVVSQLKTLKAPADLHLLVEGESLFNDATAIALFSILLSIGLGTSQPTVLSALMAFVKIFFGGVVLGGALGAAFACLNRWSKTGPSGIALITLVLAYGSFFVGEHLLHVSGIVAVLFAAVAFRLLAQRELNHHGQQAHQIWQVIGFIANVFVFVLLGLVLSSDMFTERWLAILIAIAAVTLARLVAVYLSVGLNQFTLGQPLPASYPPILIWGGLRGAVTIALVLSLPTELPYWWTIQSIGFGVVLFTLLVQATTTPLLMRKLRVSEEKSTD